MKSKPTPDRNVVPGEVADAEVYVLGGGRVGAAIARRLQADGHSTVLIDEVHEPADVSTRRADPTDLGALAEAGLEGASTVVVATPSDSRNLLAAQLVRRAFDVDRIVVRTNDPELVDTVADSGHETVCATTAVADAVAASL